MSCHSRRTSTRSRRRPASPLARLVEQAKERGFDGEQVKAGEILAWLQADHGLGRGHGMALVHVIKKGPQIDAKHVGSTGSHRDESDMLWLDGKDSKPA